MTLLLPPTTVQVSAAGETRTLYLHHAHTGETGHFTFKRNGRYDQGALRELNRFLADWRNKKETNMDPALFDLLWLVYQEVGASKPITIVSSYRSPETNKALRAKSSGVAENSQHMTGKAMDFFIPGVPLKTLRETAMKYQVGGVGYYPTSGSPFVHLDTGTVRAWPRMTTAQLKKIFPDGRTLHLPSDGRPLSEDGRRYAQAEWNKCRMVPCNGALPRTDNGLENPPQPATPGRNLMDMIFGNGTSGDVQVAAVEQAPTQRSVALVAVSAPVPMPRPQLLDAAPVVPFNNPSAPLETAALDPNAPVPVQKSQTLLIATAAPATATPALPAQPADSGETALVALANLGAPTPKARVLMTNPQPEPSTMVTAYVPTITPDPGAQRALEMIIEREATAAAFPAPRPAALDAAPVHTASLGSVSTLQNMLESTWDAVTSVAQPPITAALLSHAVPQNASFEMAPVELVAPDLEHVADILAAPVPLSSGHFSELYEAEGYLTKTTELGSLVTRIEFEQGVPVRAYDRFDPSPLIQVALR